jgi:serine/threonine protein kinase
MIDPEGFGGGHGVGTDHWALGILLYEMLAGENPFWYEDMPELELYQQIPRENVAFGPVRKYCTDEDAIDLIRGLLVKDPRQRLGAQGESYVLEHAWLAPTHILGEIAAPWIPDLTDLTDTQYFDDWESEVEDRFAHDYPALTQTEEAHFVDF